MRRQDDDWGTALASGLSVLSTYTRKIAQQASELTQVRGRAAPAPPHAWQTLSENVIAPTAAKVKDSEFWSQVGQQVKVLGSKARPTTRALTTQRQQAIAATTEGISTVSTLLEGKQRLGALQCVLLDSPVAAPAARRAGCASPPTPVQTPTFSARSWPRPRRRRRAPSLHPVRVRGVPIEGHV